MRFIFSLYNLASARYLAYMLQQVEYDTSKFVSWYLRLAKENRPLSKVAHRQQLEYTPKIKLLLLSLVFAYVMLVSLGLLIFNQNSAIAYVALLFVLSPVINFSLLYVVSSVAWKIIILPGRKKSQASAKKVFHNHTALKIAVVGSYGKTTVKELLNTILSEKFNVASTPGNKNVITSHATFANKLDGNEEIIILEFGEGEPGDVENMTDMFSPDWVFITGLAPNHLDQYQSMEQIAEDFKSSYKTLGRKKVYLNSESSELARYIETENMLSYSRKGCGNVKVSTVDIDFSNMKIHASLDGSELQLNSRLIGEHLVGPIVAVADLAAKLGMSNTEIEHAVKRAAPYEHRMQPRNLYGAWIIDDTYNGNLEGMIAGLELLSKSDAKRKWYVTPGLVDQGSESHRVHQELGKYIARANPDIVVLMKNSVQNIIQDAMTAHNYEGEIRIEDNPLHFYQSLEHLVVPGDVVLMQNDWTDNYN